MSRQKVSIILPVSNASQHIIACLDSIIFQSVDEIETILVPGAGDDGSMDKVDKYLLDYHGDKVFRTLEPASDDCRLPSLDRAVAAAEGEYLVFVDANDVIEPGFCEDMYSAALRSKADIVCCDFLQDVVGDGRSRLFNAPRFFRRELSVRRRKQLLRKCEFRIMSFAFSRQFINANSIRFNQPRIPDDVCFLDSSIIMAKRMTVVRKPLYRRRVRNAYPSSASDNGRYRQRTESFDSLIGYARKWGNYDDYSDEIIFSYIRNSFLHSIFSYVRTAGQPDTYIISEMLGSFKAKFPDYSSNRYYRASAKCRLMMTAIEKWPQIAIRLIQSNLFKSKITF